MANGENFESWGIMMSGGWAHGHFRLWMGTIIAACAAQMLKSNMGQASSHC
jgi:hypothetical protein